jgi:ribose transport system substrate-binding protein
MTKRTTRSARSLATRGGFALAAVALVTASACSSDGDSTSGSDTSDATSDTAATDDSTVEVEQTAGGDNDAPGDTVVIGFSAPAADHGWMAAITNSARDTADGFSDVELQVAEGTNDVNLQISQVETFINDGVDAIVLLPFDGAAMTPVALEAMQAGIPVINVDREFSDPNAARVTVLGDNYGMGVSAGEYICEQVGDNPDAVVAEIAGIDSLPLTQDRSQGFADALAECGQDVDNRVAADFTVEGGEQAASNLLQAAPQIDAVWNHDDDQGVGVLAAFNSAGRDEFIMVGGAGSANAMRAIQDDDSVLKATVIYPSTQGADGIALARLLAQGKSMSDLVEVEVPRTIQLYAPVVTKDNVDQFLGNAFES